MTTKTFVLIITSALCVAAIIGSAFIFWGRSQHVAPPPATALPKPTPTATIHPLGWKLYSDVSNGFSFQYPSDWTIYQISSTELGLLPPGSRPDPKYEYVADIILSVLANPSAFDLTTFYTSVSDFNPFKYSSPSWFTVNSAPAVRFTDVSGMFPTTTVAVAHVNIVLEISDVAQLHETDGVFDSIVASIH